MQQLFEIVEQLEKANIHFRIARNRTDAISIEIVVPGERWEIDFLKDGEVAVEIFQSNGQIHGGEKLTDLFKHFSDQQ